MSEIIVIYWSQSGNTMSMANAVAEGIKEAGKEAAVLEVSAVTAADLNDETVFALGCPAMGAEELEETEMEPFVAELEGSVSGKKIGLVGSYGWGDGEWMRTWEENCKNEGAVLTHESVICQEEPDDDAKAACQELGKSLA